MKKKYYVIVLTGGPCGGKTSGIVGVADHLESLGYRVIIVSEAATRIMDGRVSVKRFGLGPFQSHVVRVSLADELLARQLAEEISTEEHPLVILLDRTWHDCRAYMPEDDWLAAGRETHAATLAPLAGYDGVIHIDTTAKESFALYERLKGNNPNRFETPEGAVDKDDLLIRAYQGSERWDEVGNSGGFARKIELAIEAACRAIGLPEPRWCQRKFSVTKVDYAALEALRPVKIDIFEYHLDGFTFRRRKLGDDGSESYARIRKEPLLDRAGESLKIVTPIDDVIFYGGWERARASGASYSDRRRYSLAWKGVRVVLDEYRKPAGRMLFEAHLGSMGDSFEPPPWLETQREVTGDPRHTAEYYANPAPP